MTAPHDPRILLDGLTFGESPAGTMAGCGSRTGAPGRSSPSTCAAGVRSSPARRAPPAASTSCPTAACCSSPAGRDSSCAARRTARSPATPTCDPSPAHPGTRSSPIPGSGNLYLNNIGFDFPAGDPFPDRSSGRAGRRGAAGGGRRRLSHGMAVTPDGATLIVAESYAGRLTAFDIGAGGTLSGRRTWADLGDGAPDGICLDAEGAVWYADVPNRRCVRVREGGAVLDSVDLDQRSASPAPWVARTVGPCSWSPTSGRGT